MMVLVVGLLERDSGKTSITVSMLNTARELGFNAVGFKPVGGHNAWNQYDTLARSLSLRMLVGEDAFKLWVASNRVESIDLLSPLDILLAPPDPAKVSLEDYTGLEKTAVLARLTKLDNGKIFSTHFVVRENLMNIAPTLRRELLKLAYLTKAINISATRLVNIVSNSAEYIDRVLKYLLDKYRLVIVESFNNAAFPTPFSLTADWVVLVAPTRVFIYRGKDYAKTVEEIAAIRGVTITVPEVVKYVKPEKVLEICPRTRSELGCVKKDSIEILDYITEKHLIKEKAR